MKIYPSLYNNDNLISIKWENDFEEESMIAILQPKDRNDWRPIIGYMYGNVLHLHPVTDKQFKIIKKHLKEFSGGEKHG